MLGNQPGDYVYLRFSGNLKPSVSDISVIGAGIILDKFDEDNPTRIFFNGDADASDYINDKGETCKLKTPKLSGATSQPSWMQFPKPDEGNSTSSTGSGGSGGDGESGGGTTSESTGGVNCTDICEAGIKCMESGAITVSACVTKCQNDGDAEQQTAQACLDEHGDNCATLMPCMIAASQ